MYGLEFLKTSLFDKLSTKFLFDLVPPWTGKPGGLFITTKFSLFSIIKLSLEYISFLVGTYFFLFKNVVSGLKL